MPLITERMQEIIDNFTSAYPGRINNENRFLVTEIALLMEKVEILEAKLTNAEN